MSGPYDPFGSSPFSGGAEQEPSEPASQEPSPSTPEPGYGQPAQPAQPSAWGQPSAPEQSPAWGQLSAPEQYPYGRPSVEPSQPLTSGQSGQLGEQPGTPTPPFGQPAAPSQPYASPYGPPAAPSQPFPPGPYPYGQPAAPSQPFTSGQYPYGQAAAPSQPLVSGQYPYGQMAAPSQPWQTMPGQQPAPGWSPVSQTLPGMAPPGALTAAAPRKSRRMLWISLGVAAALIVLTAGGGAFAFSQYIAPATAAGTFCGYLKAQDYTAAYGLFSANLKSQFPQDQFTQGANTLDKVEGAVLSCGQAKSGNAYSYSLFSSTAQVNAAITRATAGELDGAIRLKSENGAWKVDALDTSLLGVNLGALQAAGAFCAALQSQNYAAAYALLGSAPQLTVKQTDFLTQAQLHDQIDGSVTACGLVAIAPGASDTSASLTASITRGKLGEKQGNMNLDVEAGAWKVSTLADTLLGSDLGPYQVGTRFCADLASANFADAYTIVTQNFKGGQTEAQFAAAFTLPAPYKWGCKPDLSTYKVSGSSTSYTVSVTVTDPSTGQSGAQNVSFGFVQEGGVWKLDSTAKA